MWWATRSKPKSPRRRAAQALLGGEFGALLLQYSNEPVHAIGLDHHPILMAQGNRHAHTLYHDVENLVLAVLIPDPPHSGDRFAFGPVNLCADQRQARLGSVLLDFQDREHFPGGLGQHGEELPHVHLFEGIDEVLALRRRGSAPMFAEHEAADRGHIEPLPAQGAEVLLFLGLVERRICEHGDGVLVQRFKERARVQSLGARHKQALRWEIVARNAATLVDAPRVPHHEIKPFTPDQARAFLDAIRGDRLEALYSVALALGLRKGEVLGLRWDDIDLEKGTLTVRSSLQRIDGKLTLVEPKSKQSRRTVAMPQTVASALRLHRARQLQERLLAGSRWQNRGFVFPTTIGTPMDTRNLTRHFKRALSEAGLPSLRFHDLRHSCASLLLAQGIHPRVVMEILGHSQINLTMNTYSHVIDDLKREAAAQMDAVLEA